MPISPPYLIPFQLLLTVLSACGAAKILTPSLATSDGISRRLTRGLLAGILAVTAALGAFATLLVLRYEAQAAASSAQWESALASAPDDAWLLGRRAESSLRSGHPREAAADFSRALARAPLDGELRSLHAYALALSGRPAALELLRLGPEATSQARYRLPELRPLLPPGAERHAKHARSCEARSPTGRPRAPPSTA